MVVNPTPVARLSHYARTDVILAAGLFSPAQFQFDTSGAYMAREGTEMMRFPLAGGLIGGLRISRIFVIDSSGTLMARNIRIWFFSDLPGLVSNDHETFAVDDQYDDLCQDFAEISVMDWLSIGNGKIVTRLDTAIEIKLPRDYADLYAQVEFINGSPALPDPTAVSVKIAVTKD